MPNVLRGLILLMSGGTVQIFIGNKGIFISWFQKYGTEIRHLSYQVVKPIIFLFSWKSSIDENGLLNYHTTTKNYQNLLQKWWFRTATYCALNHSLYNRPTTQAIGKIVKKFDETGVVLNIERPVHHHFACFTENITIVSESVADVPSVELSYGVLLRILNLDPKPSISEASWPFTMSYIRGMGAWTTSSGQQFFEQNFLKRWKIFHTQCVC